MALIYLILIFLSVIQIGTCLDGFEYFRGQDLDLAAHYWSDDLLLHKNNSSLLGLPSGCSYCSGESFYHEPPPNNIILFMPPPPIHPSFQNSLSDLYNGNLAKSEKQPREQCNLCNMFYNGGQQLISNNEHKQSVHDKVVFILVSFILISGLLFIYLFSSRRTKIIDALKRNNLFKAKNQPHNNIAAHTLDKNNPFLESMSNSGVHITDPCFLQTNGDKNLTSPIISDHVSHKKTSIPSKCWAQPNSIIGRTIRKIPNEYEIPSSRTNSTGTSSAIYTDMNNDQNNARCFAPYNLHTYAEVREVLDPSEHFHTSSNSSVMLSDSNYDNAVFSHNGSCVITNGSILTGVPNSSVQMSDFNSMRPVQSVTYGQTNSLNHAHQIHQARSNQNNGHMMYDQAQQRPQVMVTSNNQGVNPTLLSYNVRVRNVI